MVDTPIQTIKFSQMTSGGDIANNDTTPGLLSGQNVLFNNPWTFLAPGSTAQRPVPSASIYYRLRLNTDTQTYEYYNPNVMQWTELSGSGTGTVNPGTTNSIAYYAANGTTLSPISSIANAVFLSNSSGVPSFSTTLPASLTIPSATITNSTASLTSGTIAAVPSSSTDIVNKSYVDTKFASGVTSITGTTNQVIASSATGDVTLSLPQDIATGSSPTFSALTLSSSTAHGVLLGQASSAINSVLLGAGKLLIGTTSGDPSAANLTEGQNIGITSASGSITVAFSGNLPVTNLDSGTSASATTFWRGDGTWGTPAGTGVSSAQGTQHQVLVNGTYGTPTTGAITYTTPQNIDTTSAVQFASVQAPNYRDPNGSTVLNIATQAPSSVNYFTMYNRVTGSGPIITAAGSDTNIDFRLNTSGTGQFVFNSLNTTTPIVINSGTTYQHITNFNFSNTSVTRTVTFPDVTGTIPLSTSLGTSGQLLQSSGASSAAAFTTATYPNTVTANNILYGSSSNVVGQLTPGTGVITALGQNVSGSGSIALTTSPTFVTPTLGAATATSITFGGTVLNTYSVGTATPTITCTTPGDLSVSYALQSLNVQTIGTVKHVNIIIQATPTYTTATGTLIISGLPTAATANNQFCWAMVGGTTYAIPANLTGYIGSFANSSTNISIGYLRTTAGTSIGLPITQFPSGNAMIISINGVYF